MFELIISILIALGFSPVKTDSGMLVIDNTVIMKAKADGRFESSGGEAAMSSITIVSSTPLTEVIVTEQVDPNAVH